MFESYRRVFAHPGAIAFSSAGLVARLPISMMTLGIVLLVSTLSGSYALAGQVSAAYIIANAAVAIPHGRLVDRFGQRPVLLVDAVAFALAAGMLVVAQTRDWGLGWSLLWAAGAGLFIPPIGSLVRARWANLLDSDGERHTAFSVEGIADEVVFVTGPAIVTFLSTAYAPQAGVVVAVIAGTVGTVLLAAQRRTEPPATRHHPATATGPLPWPPLLALGFAALTLGCLFGAIEVATVAFAEDRGSKAASGALLAVFALGSLIAGVVTGATQMSMPVRRRFQVGIVVLAAAMVVLPFVGSLVLMAVVLLAIGSSLAPTLIAMFSLLEASAPRARLTEAMAYVQTGISAGIAPGAWAAGEVADRTGGSAAYWVCVAAGGVAVLAALVAPDPGSRAAATTPSEQGAGE